LASAATRDVAAPTSLPDPREVVPSATGPTVASALYPRVSRADGQPLDERLEAPTQPQPWSASERPGDRDQASQQAFQPLLPRAQSQADTSALAKNPLDSEQNRPTKDERSGSRASGEGAGAGRSIHRGLEGDPPRSSDVAPSLLRRPGDRIEGLAPLVGRPTSAVGGAFSARAPAPDRAPDEVRIHIGRVEVIAAPAAAPRPPTAPARKTMTLEEYLARRSAATR
jgi:hypothetical protein